MTRAQELLEQVKALPPEEREEFDLLYSYGPDEDFELSDEWKAEIARRVEEIENGTAKTRTWDEVEVEYAAMKERKHRSAAS
jgi:putative addiction module component (TIGR02574 family)